LKWPNLFSLKCCINKVVVAQITFGKVTTDKFAIEKFTDLHLFFDVIDVVKGFILVKDTFFCAAHKFRTYKVL